MELDLKQLNAVLENLQYPNRSLVESVQREDIDTPIRADDDGRMGEENVYSNVYKIKGMDNLYLKVIYHTDSYGDGDYVRGVQFVVPVEKTVKIFEPVK